MNLKAAERSKAIDPEQTIEQGVLPNSADEEGARLLRTPQGFVLYLTFVSLHGSSDSNAGAGHSYGYLNEGNDISGAKWNPYRDLYTYRCLTGEWALAEQLPDPAQYRRRWFSGQVRTLRVAPNPWEARHTVNDVVREEMEAMDMPAGDGLTSFLQRCFSVMGHIMAGVPAGPYIVQAADVYGEGECRVEMLHELFRRQSIYLWKVLEEKASRIKLSTLSAAVDGAQQAYRAARHDDARSASREDPDDL